MDEASFSHIRKVAGGQDPAALAALLGGMSGPEIDARVDSSGKSALHLAAWRGCLGNVGLLLDRGASVDCCATGEFSYGKTPIFFAITQVCTAPKTR